ncbi:hypothetical protein G6N82_11240 [Altererythrobacter sp. BO-6]|uniref:hypothetical protein n=1 Tax=Altererythrobacter sp. BO-6 TaxID=2604537 RepID=UPI0013E1A892|nr:hypothetical protein [Altererythrobacter sp. BO-6]QIG54648.1 hypothetical protein G6N82_11240 [Altererythrobacter sp. BO-6]
MRSLTLVFLPAAFALAACGDSALQRDNDARRAEGEVLGGTISDEMLPLDQIQSQSPILRETPAAPGAEGEEGEEADDAAAEESDGAPPAEPAEPSQPQE